METLDWILLAKVILMILYMLLERWMGRTKKVEANSVLDFIFGLLTRRK